MVDVWDTLCTAAVVLHLKCFGFSQFFNRESNLYHACKIFSVVVWLLVCAMCDDTGLLFFPVLHFAECFLTPSGALHSHCDTTDSSDTICSLSGVSHPLQIGHTRHPLHPHIHSPVETAVVHTRHFSTNPSLASQFSNLFRDQILQLADTKWFYDSG